MVVQPAARGPEEVQGVQPERLGKASSERETVAWALQKEKHSCAGKELEAEDPPEAKTGTGKERGSPKRLSEAHHLSGLERTEAWRTWTLC